MSDSVEQCSAVAIRSSHRYRSPEQVEEKAAVVRVEPRGLVVCGVGIVLLVVALMSMTPELSDGLNTSVPAANVGSGRPANLSYSTSAAKITSVSV